MLSYRNGGLDMARKWMNRRVMVLLAVIGVAVAVGAFVWLTPSAEAADCGGTSGGMSYEWVASSPAAIAKTLAGDCGSNAVCEEWCIVACDDDFIPQGQFRCVPE